MRLSESERNHLRACIEHFNSEIDLTRMQKGSMADTFSAMMAYPSADLGSKRLAAKLDDLDPSGDNIDFAQQSKLAALNYIAGIYAMEKELSKRTWKDYLRHPFKSIAERIAFSQQKDNAKEKFGLDTAKYNMMMDNIAEINGDKRAHGTVDPQAKQKRKHKKVKAEKTQTLDDILDKIEKESRDHANDLFSDDFEKESNQKTNEEVLDVEKLEKDVSLEKTNAQKSEPVKDTQIQIEIQNPSVSNE